jgi:hypothetical protein
MRRFLRRINAIPDATFQERVDSVVYRLFHDGINVPDYVTMPWHPAFVSQVLAGSGSRAYVLNNLAPQLEWGHDGANLSDALDWIQTNIADTNLPWSAIRKEKPAPRAIFPRE